MILWNWVLVAFGLLRFFSQIVPNFIAQCLRIIPVANFLWHVVRVRWFAASTGTPLHFELTDFLAAAIGWINHLIWFCWSVSHDAICLLTLCLLWIEIRSSDDNLRLQNWKVIRRMLFSDCYQWPVCVRYLYLPCNECSYVCFLPTREKWKFVLQTKQSSDKKSNGNCCSQTKKLRSKLNTNARIDRDVIKPIQSQF